MRQRAHRALHRRSLGPSGLEGFSGRFTQHRLDNGLEVCLLEQRSAPVVTCALFYRAGTRDEEAGQGGIAHFLEHMMFKGSARFGPGEIDQRTQALGGTNNAYTSHDLTVYHFDFAPDRWSLALSVEADRMRGLTLDPDEVASERQVVLEEISMSEAEPWDALEAAVARETYAGHAYGKPVLGTRAELLGVGPEELRRFHARHYQPANALLMVAGDVGPESLGVIEEHLGGLTGPGAPERPSPPPRPSARGLRRIAQERGEVARFLLTLPGPAAAHEDAAGVKMLLTALGGGRSSRLVRALVEEGQLASWVALDLAEMQHPGHILVAGELVPGVAPEQLEERLFAELARVRREGLSSAEVARARQVTLADWVFGHERIHHQANTLGHAAALYDPGHPGRQLAQVRALEAAALTALAARYLDPEQDGVLGWSLASAEEAE
jgi:zinc protease